jgi:hypothetical protein
MRYDDRSREWSFSQYWYGCTKTVQPHKYFMSSPGTGEGRGKGLEDVEGAFDVVAVVILVDVLVQYYPSIVV